MRCLPALVLALALVVTSCQGGDRAAPPSAKAAPAAPPAVADKIDEAIGHRRDASAFVGSASRAAIGDLDGDGKNEIVLADPQHLWVTDAAGKQLAAVDAPGGIEVLVVMRMPGDVRDEIVAGWGMSREHKTAGAKVIGYRFDGGKLVEEPILEPDTPRAEVAALVPGRDGKLLIAYYDSKYTVHSVYATRGATWSLTDIATIRMAASYARADVDGDGVLDLIVGRVYGDDIGKDGDAFVLRPDGTRLPIPTTRGVRELAAVDTDGDGRAEIYLADGWHQDYARTAKGLLTEATVHGGSATSELVEDIAGEYSAGRIVPADLAGDGKLALVTAGSKVVRVFRRAGAGGRWTGQSIAGVARDIAVGDLDGVPGDEILVVGERSEVISLH
jgi:hypothetical protein